MSATDAQLAQLEAMKHGIPIPKADPSASRLTPELEDERDAYVAGLSHSD